MKNSELRVGAPGDVGMDPARIRLLRDRLREWVENGDHPSVVALVARRGVIVLHEAFGVRRYDDETSTLRTDSIFPVASLAKPITAAAVMCLVEDGLIGLNRPFIDYVPELDVPGVRWIEEARVADLLCHTSGIDDIDFGAFIETAQRGSPQIPAAGPGQHPFLNVRIRMAAGAPLTRRPGTAMVYSNFGYNLLGDIVRRVSGQPFWQFVQSRLFDPLGMHDSHFVLPQELRDRRVYRAPGMPGTVWVPKLGTGGLDSPEHDERDFGSNGLLSTVDDLAAFMKMFLNRGTYGGRQILSQATIAAMTRNQVDMSIPWVMPRIDPTTGERLEIQFRGGGYGYGVFIFGPGDRFKPNGALASLSAIGHIGYAGAYMWADPERELLAVYLSVSPRLRRDAPTTNVDLFQNAVHASIID